MKILLQNQLEGEYAGCETYFMHLVRQLRAGGHDVICAYTRMGFRTEPEQTGCSVKKIYLPYFETPLDQLQVDPSGRREFKRDVANLKTLIRQEKVDVVHLNNTHNPFVGLALQEVAPVLQMVHDHYHTCPTILRQRKDGSVCLTRQGTACFRYGCVRPWRRADMVRFLNNRFNLDAIRRMDGVMTASSFMAETMVANGIRPDRVFSNPLFVDDPGVKREQRDGPPCILYVGRLAVEKGVDHFLRALAMLKRPFVSRVVGDGPDRTRLRALTGALGLGDRVSFDGFVDSANIGTLYRKADLVVVPSVWPEPFCMVGLEAMSFRLPVVGYAVGGIPTWLDHGTTGLAAAAADIGQLAASIEGLMSDPGRAWAMGEAGYAKFRKEFNEHGHIDRLVAIYRTLVAERSEQVTRGGRDG